MNRQAYPSDLSDTEWQLLEPLLPAPKPGGRPVKYPRREVVNAIMYVLRSGCPWRMIRVWRVPEPIPMRGNQRLWTPQLGRCSTHHGKNIGNYLKGKKRPFVEHPAP